MPDFTEILNKPAALVEKPKPRPTGHYLCQLTGMPDQIDRKDNAILSFKVKCLAPQGDVDSEALANQPDVASWPPMKYDIFINDPWPLKRYLTEVLGIDPGPEDNSRTLGEMLSEAPGKQCLFEMAHRPYTDNDGQPAIASELKNPARV